MNQPVFVIILISIITIIEGRAVTESNHIISDENELKFVNIVFRHGDRAPDPAEMFPKDPHYRDKFFPMGPGGLTNAGKRRIYKLGQKLRERYDGFLGDYYLSNSVEARSTDYTRTKMGLQLILSALYPPKGDQVWNKHLLWQPIPTRYVDGPNDSILIPEECPKYLEERARITQSQDVISKIDELRPFMSELTTYTGMNVTSPNDMYNLYHILVSEKAMGLRLPDWTEEIFPDGRLLDGIKLEYEIFTNNDEMRKLNGGMLLREFVDSMLEVRDGALSDSRKLHVYSGHETNIAALLQTLGLFEPHVPQYSSAVIIELYQNIVDKEYYVKVVYYRGIPSEFQEMEIPGCAERCSLGHFLKVYEPVIPTDYDKVCVKPNKNDKHP